MDQEHTLPWDLADIDEKDITEGLMSKVYSKSLREALAGKNLIAADSGLVVGDGKNLYTLRLNEDTEAFLEGDIEGSIYVDASCLGVCNTDKYESIVEEEGFVGVVELVNSVEYERYPSGEVGITDADEAARYVPEEGIVYPENEKEIDVSRDEFFDSEAARKTVEDALSTNRPGSY